MASFNRVVIMGNTTRDTEVRYLANGTAVGDTCVAISESRKDANGNKIEDVTFVDVTLWGRTAEVAGEYLTKGSPVLIEGRLKLDSWQTQEGQKRSKLKVVAETMRLLGGRSPGDAQKHREEQKRVEEPKEKEEEQAVADGEDIPF